MTGIHQLVPGYAPYDAVSHEANLFRGLFRSWGYRAQIFTETRRILPELRRDIGDISVLADQCNEDDIVLLHLSSGGAVNHLFSKLPCRKAILYHNITPPEFFRGIQEQIYNTQLNGLKDVKRLAGVADVVMACSSFSANELTALGYQDVKILPFLIDESQIQGRVNQRILKKYQDGRKNIVFISRWAPNKRVEDALCAFYYYEGSFVVLEWVNHGCPFVKKHYKSGNMQKLQEGYTAKDVVWLSICSSAPGKQGYCSADEAQEISAEKKSACSAYLMDEEGTVGRQYGAKTTPHMYIINPDGNLIYQGAIDSIRSTDPSDVRKADNYVAMALDAAMAGEPVESASTRPYGCSVKYK